MSTYLPTTPAAPRTADIHLTDITYTADKTPTLTIPQLTLTPGITAIIGPKGAGKTAFLHLLTTLTLAASGTLTMGGTTVPTTHSPGGASAHDLATLRAHIGYVPTYFDVDPNTPIHALATYAAWLRGYDGDHAHTAARTAIDNINLTSNAHKRLPARHVRKRNNGHRVTDHHPVLRAHVALALATAGAPTFLLLDDPASGLTSEPHRSDYYALLRRTDSRTILFTSTELNDATHADRVLILNDGHIVDDQPAHLITGTSEVAQTTTPPQR